MRVLAEYKKRAKQCRDLAARASNPANKKRLKYEARTWAKMAGLREHNLTDIKSRTNPARDLILSQKQIRQLGDVRCDPSRLIFAKQLGRRAPTEKGT